MKLLSKIGIGILSIIVSLLIVALFISNDFKVERTIIIEVPIDSVWANVNSFSALDKWDPWYDFDKEQKKEVTGIDGTVGAKNTWTSKVGIVGNGSQTLSKIEPPNLIETNVIVTSPRSLNAKGFLILEKSEVNTKVRWGIIVHLDYPSNLMKLLTKGKKMGEVLSSGLSKLKIICEKEKIYDKH